WSHADRRTVVFHAPRSDEWLQYHLGSVELEQPGRKRSGSICHQRMSGRWRDRLRLEQQWHGEPARGLRYPRNTGRRHHAGAQLPVAARHGIGWSVRGDSPQTPLVILLAVHFESRSQPAPAFGFLGQWWKPPHLCGGRRSRGLPPQRLTMRLGLPRAGRRWRGSLRRRARRSPGRGRSRRRHVGRRRRSQLLHIGRNNTLHRRRMLHLARFRIRHINTQLRQGFRRVQIQLYFRLLVIGSSVENIGFGLGQAAGGLQYESRGGSPIAELLLLRRQALIGIVAGGDRRLQGGIVLLHGKLRIAHLQRYLVLGLLQGNLRLTVFQLRPHLFGLRGTVAERNVEVHSDSFVGC